MTSPEIEKIESASDDPIPSGSLRSRRSELDTDLHSASSHSRQRSVSRGGGGPSPHHLTRSLHSGKHEQRQKARAQRHLEKGIVNYDDTDSESDEDYDSADDEDDDCTSFCEPTNHCVANNRYLCRGMSIEIVEMHDVSEFDDQAVEPLESAENVL